MSDKDILIFDEPASMLDPISELQQFTHIKEKIEGSTAILISHRVGFARLADRIILLSEGKVAEVGTHDELMAKNGLYADFFNEQAQWYRKEEEEAAANG
jgi:ATP-binding cassette subfamily B protein